MTVKEIREKEAKFERALQDRGSARSIDGSADYKIIEWGGLYGQGPGSPALERVIAGEREVIVGIRSEVFPSRGQVLIFASYDHRTRFVNPALERAQPPE